MKNMTASRQMFIRACKSIDPIARVMKTYDRFYVLNSKGNEDYIAIILAEICEDLNLITIPKLVEKLNPNIDSFPCDVEPKTYTEMVIYTLISQIRFAEVSKLEGYTIPVKWRL